MDLLLQGQIDHAENGVHGGAEFVADIGQEAALGRVGGLGGAGVLLRAVQEADASTAMATWSATVFIKPNSSSAKAGLLREPKQSVPMNRPWFKSG